MGRIVFDSWSSDRYLLDRYFRGAGDFRGYTVDSDHNVTSLTRRDGNGGYVFVGTPARCPDFIGKMYGLKSSFVDRGYRASPKVIDFDNGIAGFAWIASRGKK